ncbi:MAG TPA: alpha/beta hydrolase [Acidimicrobiales bacterium]|nr:alpha/beta hydrolase [Acidimicrobiales bacterium]
MTVDVAARLDRSTLDVGGAEVTVARGGEGDPLLYLHGLCGDVHSSFPGTDWTPFLGRLGANFDVVAPALPGYNGSAGPAGFDDVEDYVFHLADLLEVLDIESVCLVGHSFGAWMAAELALRRPDLVEAMVLLSPLGVRVRGLAVPPFFGAVAPRGIGGFAEARQLLFADPEGEAARRALPDDMGREHQLLWFGGLQGAARLGWAAPHFQSPVLTRRLRRIDVPTLVVRGGADRLVPDQMAEVWVRSMPEAQLHEVPGVGHCLPAERPEVAADVEGFLGEFHGGLP